VWFTDQFADPRLTEAVLIIAGLQGGHAPLTASGRALLEAVSVQSPGEVEAATEVNV
jgi:hypothetical protein